MEFLVVLVCLAKSRQLKELQETKQTMTVARK